MIHKQDKIKKKVLPNGLTLYHEYNRKASLVEVSAIVHAGAKDEYVPGVAHFVEHIVTTNTPGKKKDSLFFLSDTSSEDTQVFFDFSFTDYVTTVYGFSLTPGNQEVFEHALALFEHRLFRSSMSESLEGHAETIISEIGAMSEKLFPNTVSTHLATSLGAGSWLEVRPFVRAKKEDIPAIGADDLFDFYDRYYQPENTTLIISGPISFTDTVALCTKVFGNICSKEIDTYRSFSEILPITHVFADDWVSDTKPLQLATKPEQNMAYITWVVPLSNPDDFFFVHFVTSLLQGMLSRGGMFRGRNLYASKVFPIFYGDAASITLVLSDAFPLDLASVEEIVTKLRCEKTIAMTYYLYAKGEGSFIRLLSRETQENLRKMRLVQAGHTREFCSLDTYEAKMLNNSATECTAFIRRWLSLPRACVVLDT